MKLHKAIEILIDHLNKWPPTHNKDSEDAVKLGIEALKQLEGLRHLPYGSPLPPLPGETKD